MDMFKKLILFLLFFQRPVWNYSDSNSSAMVQYVSI